MAHIEYFFTPVSPYTYLAGTRLEAIAARHGARRAYRLQELRRQAAKAGLPINLAPAHWPTNPAPASYAIIAAQEEGGGDLGALVHGLCRACWAGEENIAEDAVIRACLAAAGFDPGLADRGLWTAAGTYEQNLEEAVARGVFGAPFYITDTDERFWGQDRLDDLDLHLAGRL